MSAGGTTTPANNNNNSKAKDEEKAHAQNVHIVDIDSRKKKKKKKAKADDAFNNFVWLDNKEAPSLNTASTTTTSRPNIYPSLNNGNHHSPFSPPTLSSISSAEPTKKGLPAARTTTKSPYDLLKRSSCKLNPKIRIPTTTVSY